MPNSILDSDGATTGGILTWLTLGGLKAWEYMTLNHINNGLELLMVVGGFVFLLYKIQGIRLDNKKKKKDYEDSRK